VILDLLASGEVSLTSVRLLGRHLTPENHEAVLARASGRSRREIEALVAELAPQPDVPSSMQAPHVHGDVSVVERGGPGGGERPVRADARHRPFARRAASGASSHRPGDGAGALPVRRMVIPA
jgi:hypothetical protein